MKCKGMLFEAGLVKVLRDPPCVTIIWKLSLPKGEYLMRGEVSWDRVVYWLQRSQWLLLTLLSSWSHCYGLC